MIGKNAQEHVNDAVKSIFFDWKIVSELDPITLEKSSDKNMMERLLLNFITAEFTKIDYEFINNITVYHLLRLLQVSVRYLHHSKENLKKKFTDFEQKYDHLKEKALRLQDINRSLKVKSKEYKKFQKCHTCGLIYKDYNTLEYHIASEHPHLMKSWKCIRENSFDDQTKLSLELIDELDTLKQTLRLQNTSMYTTKLYLDDTVYVYEDKEEETVKVDTDVSKTLDYKIFKEIIFDQKPLVLSDNYVNYCIQRKAERFLKRSRMRNVTNEDEISDIEDRIAKTVNEQSDIVKQRHNKESIRKCFASEVESSCSVPMNIIEESRRALLSYRIKLIERYNAAENVRPSLHPLLLHDEEQVKDVYVDEDRKEASNKENVSKKDDGKEPATVNDDNKGKADNINEIKSVNDKKKDEPEFKEDVKEEKNSKVDSKKKDELDFEDETKNIKKAETIKKDELEFEEDVKEEKKSKVNSKKKDELDFEDETKNIKKVETIKKDEPVLKEDEVKTHVNKSKSLSPEKELGDDSKDPNKVVTISKHESIDMKTRSTNENLAESEKVPLPRVSRASGWGRVLTPPVQENATPSTTDKQNEEKEKDKSSTSSKQPIGKVRLEPLDLGDAADNKPKSGPKGLLRQKTTLQQKTNESPQKMTGLSGKRPNVVTISNEKEKQASPQKQSEGSNAEPKISSKTPHFNVSKPGSSTLTPPVTHPKSEETEKDTKSHDLDSHTVASPSAKEQQEKDKLLDTISQISKVNLSQSNNKEATNTTNDKGITQKAPLTKGSVKEDIKPGHNKGLKQKSSNVNLKGTKEALKEDGSDDSFDKLLNQINREMEVESKKNPSNSTNNAAPNLKNNVKVDLLESDHSSGSRNLQEAPKTLEKTNVELEIKKNNAVVDDGILSALSKFKK